REVDAKIAEINGNLENLNNFSTVIKEEYATNESVEAAFDRLQSVLDKMQNQLDSLEAEVAKLKGE
ncbi:MAG: hypothetical protein K2L00_10630, partial [Muribaculaceae bacterium]|nr:hypothetical protein [Muribaculaceae bacterium]